MAVYRHLVESIGKGFNRKLALFKELIESIKQGLDIKLAVFRKLVESIGQDLDNKTLVFRCRQFVQSTRKGLTFLLASILLNLISNRIWNVEQEHVSELMIFIYYIPMSFFHYLPLSIMTLILWCADNQFFIKFRGTGPLPLVVGPQVPQIARSLDSLVTRLPEMHVTGPPDPQVIRHLDSQVRGMPHSQITGHPDPGSTGPLDLGILDNDLRLFFYHLKQHCGLPAPEMSANSAIESISWAQASPGNMALTVHIKGVVTDVEVVYKPLVTLPGSRVLHKRFEIRPQTENFDLEDLRKLVLESMRRAQILDPECTLQLGSFAVLKYTGSGLKWWRLQDHWSPRISDVRQSPWTLLDSLSGSCRKWIVRGSNLHASTLKASTVDESENLIVSSHYKTVSGEDVLLCEESHLVQKSAPIFRRKVYICASNTVKVQDGVIFDLQSEPMHVRRLYWIFVMDNLIPSPWTTIMIFGLSLLGGWSRGTDGMHDHGLFQKLAEGHLELQHDDKISIVGVHSQGNSFFLHTLNQLCKLFQVYMFVVLIRISVATLWQLSYERIPQLGLDLLGLRRRPTGENMTSIPSPVPPAVQHTLLENISSSLTRPAPAPVDSLMKTFVFSQEDGPNAMDHLNKTPQNMQRKRKFSEASLQETKSTANQEGHDNQGFVKLLEFSEHDGPSSNGTAIGSPETERSEPAPLSGESLYGESDSGDETTFSGAASSTFVRDDDDESSPDDLKSGMGSLLSEENSSFCSQIEVTSPDSHLDIARMIAATTKHGRDEGISRTGATAPGYMRSHQDPLSACRQPSPFEQQWSPDSALPSSIPERSPLRLSQSRLSYLFLNKPDQFQPEEGRYPPWPPPAKLPVVLCQHCKILLKVPDDLPPTSQSSQKLRCGSCRKISKFSIPQAEGSSVVQGLNSSNSDSLHIRSSSGSSVGNEDLTDTCYEEMVERVLPGRADVHTINSAPSSSSSTVSSTEFRTPSDHRSSHPGGIPLNSNNDHLYPDQKAGGPYPSFNNMNPQNVNDGHSLPADEKLSSEVIRSDSESDSLHRSLSATGLPQLNQSNSRSPARLSNYPPQWVSRSSGRAPDDAPNEQGHEARGLNEMLSRTLGFTKSKRAGASHYRRRVVVNGVRIAEHQLRKAEEKAGPIHPGTYWYDVQAGFWGVVGGPCLGIIPPFIEEFSHPMTRDCAAGQTGIPVNGRELHKIDREKLCRRGLPDTPGMSYHIDIDGGVLEKVTGSELQSLGRLAPLMEKRGHGAGMYVPSNLSYGKS